MVKLMRVLAALLGAVVLLSQVTAQAPGRKGKDEPGSDKAKDYSNAPIVVKMMEFNKKKDGKLTKEELTDERLHRLFDRADTNKDGVVTKEELVALYEKEFAQGGDDRGGKGPPDKDKGGRGKDRGGPPDRSVRGGPPQPGVILPAFLQDELEMTDKQKKELADLQKDVDAKLAKILTDKQKKQLEEMRERGPKGPPDRGPKDGPPRDKGDKGPRPKDD